MTYSSASGKRLENATLGIGLLELSNGVLALRHLHVAAESLAGDLQAAAAGDTVEDQLIVERGGDQLLLAILAAPDDEEVAGTGLSALALRAVQPEDLVEAAAAGIGG